MSYVRKIQYRIEPMESYKVIRNCPGCAKKSRYSNTNNFRVNANGNKLDVWLIYQCEECKHTLNIGVYERVKPDYIDRKQYDGFLNNDVLLSKQYGVDRALFSRNRAEVDEKHVDYRLECVVNEVNTNEVNSNDMNTHKINSNDVNLNEVNTPKNSMEFYPGDIIEVVNEFGLKVRADKIAASILNVSRTKLLKLESNGILQIHDAGTEKKIEIRVIGDILNI